MSASRLQPSGAEEGEEMPPDRARHSTRPSIGAAAASSPDIGTRSSGQPSGAEEEVPKGAAGTAAPVGYELACEDFGREALCQLSGAAKVAPKGAARAATPAALRAGGGAAVAAVAAAGAPSADVARQPCGAAKEALKGVAGAATSAAPRAGGGAAGAAGDAAGDTSADAAGHPNSSKQGGLYLVRARARPTPSLPVARARVRSAGSAPVLDRLIPLRLSLHESRATNLEACPRPALPARAPWRRPAAALTVPPTSARPPPPAGRPGARQVARSSEARSSEALKAPPWPALDLCIGE